MSGVHPTTERMNNCYATLRRRASPRLRMGVSYKRPKIREVDVFEDYSGNYVRTAMRLCAG